MPATSPYQNNDYQAASTFRPFNLPINDIFKAYVAQNQFWDIGAARIKSVYDNALGMSLTLEDNKQVRDQFMKEADKQITKLSSMNVADPSVQRQGIGIFKPLLTDKAIAIDNQLTKLKQNIFSTAESFKNKKLSENGRIGEGYNVTNLQDALDGFEQFNGATPRNSGVLEQLYQNLGSKSYQPYYDYSKEMATITKNCKGVTTQETNLQEGYITSTLQSGTEAERLRECLTYGLSDAAQSQIAIEGRRAFKNGDNSINYRAMTDMYNSKYQSTLTSLTKNDDNLAAQAAAYQKRFKETGDKKLKDVIDFIGKQREGNQERIDNLIEGYNKLNLGDTEYLQQNYNKLAESIYKNSLVDGYSTAYETKLVKSDIKADPFEMLKYRISATYTNDVNLENLRFEHQKVLEAMKQGKKLKADGTLEDIKDPINPAQVEGDIIHNGIAEFYSRQQALGQQALNVTTEFYNGSVRSGWEAQGKTKDEFYNPTTGEVTEAGMTYLKTANLMSDPAVQDYFRKLEPLNIKKQIYTSMQEMVENDPEVTNLTKEWNDKLADKKTYPDITLSDGTVISAQQMYNAILNPGVETIPGLKFNVPTYVGTDPNYKVSPLAWGYMTWKGQRVQGGISAYEDTYGDIGSKLHTLYMQVATGNANNTAKIIQTKNKLFGENLIAQEGRVFGGSRNTDKEDRVRQKILTAATAAGAVGIDIDNIRIVDYSPKTGAGTIQISKGSGPKAVLPNTEDMLKVLKENIGARASKLHKALTDGTVVFDIDDPSFVDESYKTNRFTVIEDDLSNLAMLLKNNPAANDIGLRLDENSGGKNKSIFVTSPRDNVTQYQIVPYKNASGEIVFEVRVENTKNPNIPKGKFVKQFDGLTTSQVISKINN